MRLSYHYLAHDRLRWLFMTIGVLAPGACGFSAGASSAGQPVEGEAAYLPAQVSARDDPLRYRALCEAWTTRIDAFTNRHVPHELDDQRIRGMKRHYSVDPWGGDYRIEMSDRDVWVRSAGPDRRFRTGDDIIAGPGSLDLLDPRPPLMTRTEWRETK
jgi:hypothetical protein